MFIMITSIIVIINIIIMYFQNMYPCPGHMLPVSRKGTKGVSTSGVSAKFMFLDRGTCWVLPLTYLYIPHKCQGVPFPLSVKIPYFCSHSC